MKEKVLIIICHLLCITFCRSTLFVTETAQWSPARIAKEHYQNASFAILISSENGNIAENSFFPDNFPVKLPELEDCLLLLPKECLSWGSTENSSLQVGRILPDRHGIDYDYEIDAEIATTNGAMTVSAIFLELRNRLANERQNFLTQQNRNIRATQVPAFGLPPMFVGTTAADRRQNAARIPYVDQNGNVQLHRIYMNQQERIQRLNDWRQRRANYVGVINRNNRFLRIMQHVLLRLQNNPNMNEAFDFQTYAQLQNYDAEGLRVQWNDRLVRLYLNLFILHPGINMAFTADFEEATRQAVLMLNAALQAHPIVGQTVDQLQLTVEIMQLLDELRHIRERLRQILADRNKNSKPDDKGPKDDETGAGGAGGGFSGVGGGGNGGFTTSLNSKRPAQQELNYADYAVGGGTAAYGAYKFTSPADKATLKKVATSLFAVVSGYLILFT